MHQTFYIDIDEEITSIVDRLKKAKVSEIILVVPKRALLIQSIVNLKLLKKEAESLGIQIMIITQDKLGKLLIEKAGILVQNKLDENLESEEEEIRPSAEDEIFHDKDLVKEESQLGKERRDLKNIGSDDYFYSQKEKEEVAAMKDNFNERQKNDNKKGFEKIINKELVIDLSKSLKKKHIFRRKNKKALDLSAQLNMEVLEESVSPIEEKSAEKKINRGMDNNQRDQKLMKFFRVNNDQKIESEEGEPIIPKRKKEKINFHVSGKFWKLFLAFGFLAGLLLFLVGAYLFLPKVEIKIYPKVKTQSADFQIEGRANLAVIDLVDKKVPIKKVEIEEEYSQDFSSTGEKTVSNQKSQGTIIIYNEYSTASQPLVATTRFLAENGKLFRLVEGVTIPGMSKENGEYQPGKIEAKIVADQAGAEYNIEPSKFSIPGFESSGTEKYSKFYAISEKSMNGGGDGNEKVRVVTQADIENAKQKIAQNLDEKVKNRILKEAGEGWVALDETIAGEDPRFISSNSADEVANNFSLTVRVHKKALVFREDDVKDIIINDISQKNNGYETSRNSVTLEFGKADADWEAEKLTIRLRANIDMGASLDLDNLKRGILGKNEEELKETLSAYSEIEKVAIDYWPFFISGKIPMYEKRVTVVLDKN